MRRLGGRAIRSLLLHDDTDVEMPVGDVSMREEERNNDDGSQRAPTYLHGVNALAIIVQIVHQVHGVH